MNISLEENKENNVSFAWIKRLRLVKEKLMNVQTRCRDLEFLMETQKNLLEAANQNIDKLKEENQDLQANQEKMKSDFTILNETRLKEKAKIDNIITFCDLVNNCSFSREELLDKLSEIPMTISLFLKGSSDTLSLKSGDFAFKTGGCDNELVEHFGEKCEEPREKSVEEMARELEELKQTLNYVAKFVSQAFPSDDQSVLANIEKISQLRLTLKEGLETEADEPSICLNPNLDANKGNRCRKRRTICKDHIFARAIQNSSSLFWNLKVNQRGRNIHTNASTNTSMTVLEVEK